MPRQICCAQLRITVGSRDFCCSTEDSAPPLAYSITSPKLGPSVHTPYLPAQAMDAIGDG